MFSTLALSRVSFATLAIGAISLPAAAQTPATQPPGGVTVRWNNGLHIESADGAQVLQLGTLIQTDGRFALGDPPPITNTFLIRRGRILLQGRLANTTEWYLVPEFGGSVLNLLDAYVDTRLSPAFRVRAGKSKSPLGLEHLYSDATLPFAERSVATNLSPNRDVGVSVLGSLWSNRLGYHAAVLNGVNDGSSGDLDTNRGKDVAGRVTAAAGPASFALAGSRGEASGSLSGFRTVGQHTFFTYAPGVTASGPRRRVTPSVALYRGPVGGFVEYFRNTHRVSGVEVEADVTHTAWNATAVFVLTGEPVSERGAVPRAAFDPAQGQWGALQVAVRASGLTVDSRTFALGLAAPGASRRARAAGVSVVWYHSAQVKHVLMFERTSFDTPGGERRAERVLIYRFQLNLAPRL